MKNILVPTDFSSCATKAIDFAIQIAKIAPAEITLFHVIEYMGSVYDDYTGINIDLFQTLVDESTKSLEQLKKDIEEQHGILVTTVISKSPVTEGILGAMQDSNTDLIVIGTLGASGLQGKLWGSIAAEIIGKSPVPVIVIPHEYNWQKPLKILFTTNHFEEDQDLLYPLFEFAALFSAEVHVVVFTNEVADDNLIIMERARKIFPYEKNLREKFNSPLLTVSQIFGNKLEDRLEQYMDEKDFDMLVIPEII
ncbi:nucleotide-binding universal stress UspA family protein [Pedobacter sp. CG_S7]|uniref:universal stress protein n=1 Tax=Pedobacter sp. CG_S7 TaxID=3143930 RepID=UPI00339548FC